MKPITEEQAGLVSSTLPALSHANYEVVDLGPFDNNRNRLQAVNDRGQMVGVSINQSSGRIEAFLESKGTRVAL